MSIFFSDLSNSFHVYFLVSCVHILVILFQENFAFLTSTIHRNEKRPCLQGPTLFRKGAALTWLLSAIQRCSLTFYFFLAFLFCPWYAPIKVKVASACISYARLCSTVRNCLFVTEHGAANRNYCSRSACETQAIVL